MDDCLYYEELIGASLDGELTEEEEAALRAHLQSCERCRAYSGALAAVSRAVRANLPAPPDDLTENIMAAVRGAAPKKKKAVLIPFPRRVRGILAAAAVFAVLIGVGGARLLRPKGAAESAPAAAPQEAMRSVVTAAEPAAQASTSAAGMAADTEAMEEAEESAGTTEDAGETEAGNDIMRFAAPAPAMDAAPLPYILLSADGRERMGENCAALWTLGEAAALPVPEREPDYTLLDENGDLLWQLWEDEDKVLFREGEDAELYAADAGAFWSALE